MKSFVMSVLLAGLLACSSGGKDSCPEGRGACEEECGAAGTDCPAVDAGSVDLSRIDARPVEAVLRSLSVSPGGLSPAFAPTTTLYKVQVLSWVGAVRVTASAEPGVRLELNGQPLTAGVPSAPIPLGAMATMITVTARANGGAEQSYNLAVMRAPAGSLYLKSSNTSAGDIFGASLSLSGDTLAVGAPDEASKATGVGGDQSDDSARGSGAVYVFRRTGMNWALEAYIKASNTQIDDHFGSRVSLSGDTLAVGAEGEDSKAAGVGGDQSDNSAGNSGAVYVFKRTGSTWAQEAYLKASNPEADDQFGGSLALSGDSLAVGARNESSNASGIDGPQADNSARNSGAVYVFKRTGSTWAQEAYVKASNTKRGAWFGYSVSVSGDSLAVGARGESSKATGVGGDQTDTSAPDSGAVYVFRKTGTSWAQEAYIKASNAERGDNFGGTVSLSGDALAVAASAESSSAVGTNGNQADNSALNSGAVYVFRRTGTSWAQEAYIKASNAEKGDFFGYSLSLSGDGLAVGAIYESSKATGLSGDQADNSALYSGAVYVFRWTGTGWIQEAYAKASNTEKDDRFGDAVSLSGDSLAIGATGESSRATGPGGVQSDNTASHSGAVYVFP